MLYARFKLELLNMVVRCRSWDAFWSCGSLFLLYLLHMNRRWMTEWASECFLFWEDRSKNCKLWEILSANSDSLSRICICERYKLLLGNSRRAVSSEQIVSVVVHCRNISRSKEGRPTACIRTSHPMNSGLGVLKKYWEGSKSNAYS